MGRRGRGREKRQRTSLCYFCSLESTTCQWVGGSGLGQKVLFRAGGNVEISSFVYLVHFKGGGRRVSLTLYLFVSDVDPGNEDFICRRVGAKSLLPPRPASPILELNQVHKK